MSQGNHAHIDAELGALIDACEKEPIHIPQAIQSFGALLVVSADWSKVIAYSDNIQTYLPWVAPSELSPFAQQPQAILPDVFWQAASLAEQDNVDVFWEVCENLSYFAWKQENHWVVEVETYLADRHNWFDVQLQRGLAKLKKCNSHHELIQTLADVTQKYTGYERVMLYRFDEDWHGEVIAETLRGSLTSMLHHHFPASDIPPQARAMYYQNPVRLIPNSHSAPIPLIIDSAERPPFNLSRGSLRAVSPLHMQYLQNLGVAASASIAVFQDQKLWGLLACHNSKPLVIQPRQRLLALRLVEYASERLWLLHSRQVERYLRRVHDAREALAQSSPVQSSPHDLVEQHAERWLELLRSDGLYYIRGDQATLCGAVPSEPEIQALVQWLEKNNGDHLFWYTHELQDSVPGLLKSDSPFAGLLAIPLKVHADTFSYLLLFRKEQKLQRKWAGSPEKMKVETNAGTMLGPRKSFSLWAEEVRGKSMPWRTAQLYAARDLARDLLIVADSIQLSILNEKLVKLASYDDLTGVLNRRRMEEHLTTFLNTSQRYKRHFGVLLLDLDHFKRINDTFGHNAGDDVLIEVCATIQGTLRETDILGRWGGEEFMIIAPETTYPDTLHLAERICRKVAEGEWPKLPKVTVSIGVAHFESDTTWDPIVDRADKAMYEAKQQGRNRVASRLKQKKETE
ncbi:MAG: diguanylate cyclase [Gammaproteobacteria bacterium]|nr:diguanylate cyclase [Gammaproteobacteria bacterium]